MDSPSPAGLARIGADPPDDTTNNNVSSSISITTTGHVQNTCHPSVASAVSTPTPTSRIAGPHYSRANAASVLSGHHATSAAVGLVNHSSLSATASRTTASNPDRKKGPATTRTIPVEKKAALVTAAAAMATTDSVFSRNLYAELGHQHQHHQHQHHHDDDRGGSSEAGQDQQQRNGHISMAHNTAKKSGKSLFGRILHKKGHH